MKDYFAGDFDRKLLIESVGHRDENPDDFDDNIWKPGKMRLKCVTMDITDDLDEVQDP